MEGSQIYLKHPFSLVRFIDNYWDIAAGLIFGFLAYFFHNLHDVALSALFAALAISALSVTTSEVADILAEKLDEPYGSFVLTFSAVIIEILLLFMIIREAVHAPEAIETVKMGIISAIIVDMNLLLGLAVFIGGLAFKEQTHNEDTSGSYTTILFVTATVLLVPSTLWYVTYNSAIVEQASLWVAFILFCFYLLIVVFQTKTHTHFFKPTARSRIFRYRRKMKNDEDDEDDDELEGTYFFERLDIKRNIFVIFVLIAFIGFMAEIFANDGIKVFKASEMSIGVAGIIIAIISVTPELFTAIKAARNDQIQRVVNIAMGASTVSILVTVPAVMILAWFFSISMSLDFQMVQIGALFLTILLAWKTTSDGETDYLKGASLLVFFTAYVVIAAFSK